MSMKLAAAAVDSCDHKVWYAGVERHVTAFCTDLFQPIYSDRSPIPIANGSDRSITFKNTAEVKQSTCIVWIADAEHALAEFDGRLVDCEEAASWCHQYIAASR